LCAHSARSQAADGRSACTLDGALVALRCTQRLLRRLPRSTVKVDPGEATNALGHWYANVVTFGRVPFVLAISERSLLSVVLPAAPFNSLTLRFPLALAHLLQALAVPESQVLREMTLMSPLAIAVTSSRQLLGCLNQFAFELAIHVEHEPHVSLLDRMLWLSENISSAIRYSEPRELARQLLNARGTQ
jgi:hypothetical protein